MSAALQESRVLAAAPDSQLLVRRSDIHFHNVALDRVRITVKVGNSGDLPSAAQKISLQAAPLGAFVDWQDLATLDLGPIAPGGSVEVATEVPALPARRLGDFSRVPPSRLLTALAGDDEPQSGEEDGPQSGETDATWLARRLRRRQARRRQRELPSDPMDMLGRGALHWAGNINVLIGNQAVERHRAKALRIYPGRMNMAVFFVGSKRDQYQFAFEGSGVDWNPRLTDASGFPSLLASATTAGRIPHSRWITLRRRSVIMLAMSPPAACEQGSLEIHVCQRSTGREAVVEFSLDPKAAGPGCYVV